MGLRLALPRGRLLEEVRPLLIAANVPGARALEDNRRLLLETDGWRLLLARPADVVAYLLEGAADVGIVGRDALLEEGAGLVEVLDLGLGRCRLSVAGPSARYGLAGAGREAASGAGTTAGAEASATTIARLRQDPPERVATKFPHLAEKFFADLGLQPRIVELRGSLELAPLVGLADVILDLVQTGRTLRENGLQELVTVAEISARLVANRVSYGFRRSEISALADALAVHVAPGLEVGAADKSEQTGRGSEPCA